MSLPTPEFDAPAALDFLERMRSELLAAREAALADASTWGGWSVRFNQRLRDGRAHFRLLAEPPLTASPAMLACFEAASALRDLWEVMNRALEGGDADVPLARIDFESRFTEARRVIGQSAEPPEGPRF